MLINMAENKLFIIYNLRKMGWAIKTDFAFFKICVFSKQWKLSRCLYSCVFHVFIVSY